MKDDLYNFQASTHLHKCSPKHLSIEYPPLLTNFHRLASAVVLEKQWKTLPYLWPMQVCGEENASCKSRGLTMFLLTNSNGRLIILSTKPLSYAAFLLNSAPGNHFGTCFNMGKRSTRYFPRGTETSDAA